jgi:UDP-N-acetylglucosamine acyltransferase
VVLGGAPQITGDVEHGTLRIGNDNIFREFTTVNLGSSEGRGETTIGDGCLFMANSHVAHDCVVGDRVVFTNSVAVAGHVTIGDGATLGGLCAVHQHTRIGRLAMVGGGAMCAQDVPPFTIAQGDRARLYGINIMGLRKDGLETATVSNLKNAWRTLFASDLPRRDAMRRVRERYGDTPEVVELLTFMTSTRRGLCRAGTR